MDILENHSSLINTSGTSSSSPSGPLPSALAQSEDEDPLNPSTAVNSFFENFFSDHQSTNPSQLISQSAEFESEFEYKESELLFLIENEINPSPVNHEANSSNPNGIWSPSSSSTLTFVKSNNQQIGSSNSDPGSSDLIESNLFYDYYLNCLENWPPQSSSSSDPDPKSANNSDMSEMDHHNHNHVSRPHVHNNHHPPPPPAASTNMDPPLFASKVQ